MFALGERVRVRGEGLVGEIVGMKDYGPEWEFRVACEGIDHALRVNGDDLEPEQKPGEAGTGFAVGDWTRDERGAVGEVVEVKDRAGGTEYVVRSPSVRIETHNLRVVSGDDLTAARVEDSHLHMAVDHLEYVREELIAAGLWDDAERARAFLDDLYARAEGAGCAGCGSFAHPSESCPGEE